MNAYSDSALVERWISLGDPLSFREITQRHAGMVYATCKRVLGNAADAEDAAQECFLALAQTGSGIQSLPGWLHTLAVRRSQNAIRGEMRRRAREQQYAAQPSEDECPGTGETADDANWEAVQEHVDQAITELPDDLRETIIAHFLEGRPQNDIARSCGVNQATVSRRIARGIELVRDSLGKQGVAVSVAVLTALLGTRMAEAAPPTLVSALGKLALSTTTPLATPAAKAVGLLGHKGVLAVVGVIVAGITCVGGIAYLHQPERNPHLMLNRTPPGQNMPQPDDLQPAENVPAPPAAAAVTNVADSPPQADPVPIMASTPGVCSVSGRVVDERGKPVAGATVFARSTPMNVANGSTGKDGRFLIQGMETTDQFCMNAYTGIHGRGDCVATKIFGPKKLTPDGLADLVLVAYATGTIAGSLAGQDGRPIPDAQLLLMPPTMDTQYGCIRVNMEASGRFTATGVPCEEVGVYARISGASVTTDSWLERVTLRPRQHLSGMKLIYTGGDTVRLAGKVVDESGAPVGDAQIINMANRGETHSGADGSFTLRTERDSRSDIVVRHPGYQDAMQPVDNPGKVEVVLHKPGRLHGRVVHAETQQPVPSYQMLTLAGWLRHSDSIDWGKAAAVQNAEGTFDQPCATPGAVTALFRADGCADTTMAVSEEERGQELTVALPPAQTLKGFVVDAAGQPVQDARVFVDLLPVSMSSYKTYEKPNARTGADGSFTLETLAAGEHFVFADHLEHAPARQTITLPQSEPVTLALTKGCMLSGVCSGLDARTRFMVRVQLGLLRYQGPGKDDGTYEMAALPADGATVTCSLSELHGSFFDSWDLEKKAVLEEGKTTTVDFDWESANAVVEGTASFADGPARDLRIFARATGPDGTALTVNISSRPDGTFSIPRLYPGRVTLKATRGDQQGATEEISGVVDAVAGAAVSCTLAPSAPAG